MSLPIRAARSRALASPSTIRARFSPSDPADDSLRTMAARAVRSRPSAVNQERLDHLR